MVSTPLFFVVTLVRGMFARSAPVSISGWLTSPVTAIAGVDFGPGPCAAAAGFTV